MQIHTLTIDDSTSATITTMAFATEAAVYDRLREEYPDLTGLSDADVVTKLTEERAVSLYIDEHEIAVDLQSDFNLNAAGCAPVWFTPGDIDTHFNGWDEEESEALALWKGFSGNQRSDAAKTAQVFFENSDIVWEAFHDCIVDGIQTYVKEQLS